jgi:hypothetical protein
MPGALHELKVTVPHELVELARQRVGEGNLSRIVRRALAEVAGVDVDDYPVRGRGRPPKRAVVPDGEAAA